jgi:tetratricopeptide (TPR) repeat protein
MKESTRRAPGSKPPARQNAARKESSNQESAAVAQADERAALALASVLFVQFPPESLKKIGIGELEEGVPLPVQMPGPITRFDASLVTVESIVAGILRILAWQPKNRNAGLYRELAKNLRPELLAELSDAGIAKAQSRDWELAEEIFLALIGLYPERPEPLVDLALLHEDHAKLLREENRDEDADEEDARAFECYRKLLAFDPAFVPAYYHAAFFFIRTRSFERAASLLTSFISLSDDEERIGKARQVLKKLEDLGYLDTKFKEAFDFIRMGQEEKGLERAMEFVGKYPAVWNGWFLVGWAHRRLGEWEKGKEAFSRAIELGSRESDTFNEYSICQMETGDLAGARKSLEEALRIEPENVKIIVNLGALAFRQGREEEAKGFFQTALDVDPEDELAMEWLKKL